MPQQHQKPERPPLVPDMPYSMEIEAAMLNALLMESPMLHQVMPLLSEESFHNMGHQNIYRAIASLYNRNELVSMVTVYEELQRMLPDPSHYYNELAAVLRCQVTDQSAPRMAMILEDYRQRRALLTVGVRMEQWAKLLTQPLAESIEELRRQFDAVLEARSTTITTLGQERQGVMQRIADNLSGATPPPGLMCGIAQLDAEGGLEDEGLVVVGAKSSHGKTMFIDLIALNVASQGRYVAFFSLEMSRSRVATRVMAMKSLVDNNRLRRKPLTPEEQQRVEQADRLLREGADDYLLFESAPSFEQMMASVRALHHKYRLALVVVDYIQMLEVAASKTGETKAQLTGRAAHQMQQLGKQLHTTFLVASQINRNYMGEPSTEALRDSGEIKEAADQVLILWNGHKEEPPLETYPPHYRLHGQPVPTRDRVLVKLEKSRDGATTHFFMGFVPQFTLLCSLDECDKLLQMAARPDGREGEAEAPRPGQMQLDLPF